MAKLYFFLVKNYYFRKLEIKIEEIFFKNLETTTSTTTTTDILNISYKDG